MRRLAGGVRGLLPVLPFFLLTLLPLAWLLGTVSWEGAKAPVWGREGLLLGRTLLYGTAVASSAVLLAYLALVFGAFTPWVDRGLLKAFLFLALPVPGTVFAYAGLKALGLLGLPSRGFAPSWLVHTASLLPVALFILATGLHTLKKEPLHAARLLGSDARMLARILPGMLAPQVLAALGTVFLLSVGDYAIPSIFSINVYSLGIFVEYSSSLSLGSTLVKSAPLVLLQALVLLLLLGRTEPLFLTGGRKGMLTLELSLPGTLLAAGGLLLGLALLLVLLPFLLVLTDLAMWRGLPQTLARSGRDLAASLGILFRAGILALPVSYLGGWWLHSLRKGRRPALFLVLLPAFLPGSLTGAALIHLYNRPCTSGLYDSLWMPALAVLARFLPLSLLVVHASFRRLDRELVDAAFLLHPSRLKAHLQVLLPLVLPGLALGTAFLLLFGLGELGATVLVLPPGSSTVTVRLYNYLHYGASEEVLGLSFLLLAGMGGILGAAGLLSGLARRLRKMD
ncbi:hypothetical protein [Anaerotalea alkaliphila]|uniref:ABC transmembrane type-1 domain-containing protein n=1 Tax=Anaerotalea alkaliphila TaxID=2662126 RepID=A0A7X5HW68_9FIRM|nr:hypothetical protein [Anaerotalea alkaliphila]NDL67792.1 hypothetical protein [Anaerotalea alkaliphila]